MEDGPRGVRPPETMSLRDENEWFRAEVARLRKLVPNWHVQEAFDDQTRMVSLTVVVSIRDVLDIPRDILLGSYVEKYRAGLARELVEMERKHDEQTKRNAVGGSGSSGTGRDGTDGKPD